MSEGTRMLMAAVACTQGLALPELAKNMWELPPFFRMAQQGLLRDPVFSVWMDPNAAAVPAGEILFGGADAALFEGHLTFLRVISHKCAARAGTCRTAHVPCCSWSPHRLQSRPTASLAFIMRQAALRLPPALAAHGPDPSGSACMACSGDRASDCTCMQALGGAAAQRDHRGRHIRAHHSATGRAGYGQLRHHRHRHRRLPHQLGALACASLQSTWHSMHHQVLHAHAAALNSCRTSVSA